MRDHLTATCRSCFFQFRQLRAIQKLFWRLVQPRRWHRRSSGGRLDYCNSLLYGVSEDLLRRLQSVQNATARFITGARKYDHISPVLPVLVTSATKDNLQDRHFDAPVLERFGTTLPGDWLSLNLRRCPNLEIVAICNIRTAIHSKKRQWHLDQGHSRSLIPHPQSGMICLPVCKDSSIWAKPFSENCLKHFYLIDDR